MTAGECLALIEEWSRRPLDIVIATVVAQTDDGERRRFVAIAMASVARRRARESSPHDETDLLLSELAQAKQAIEAATHDIASASAVTARFLALAKGVVDRAAVSAVEWATTADIAAALVQEAVHGANGKDA